MKRDYSKCNTKQDISKRQKLELTLAAKVQVSGADVEKKKKHISRNLEKSREKLRRIRVPKRHRFKNRQKIVGYIYAFTVKINLKNHRPKTGSIARDGMNGVTSHVLR